MSSTICDAYTLYICIYNTIEFSYLNIFHTLIYYFRIQARYGSTWGTTHGTIIGSCSSINFAANEVITAVDIGSAYITPFYGTTLTCYIKFYTNIATYGPYSGCSSYNTYNLTGGLAYLIGNCGQRIDGLKLAYYN